MNYHGTFCGVLSTPPAMMDDGFCKGWDAALDCIRQRPNEILPNIERLIFNDPATTVYWNDGTKNGGEVSAWGYIQSGNWFDGCYA